MSKSFPEWWKHGQKVRTASDGILTLNIAEDAEYWLTNNAGKEVSVFSMDILGPASVPEACRMTTDITELAQNPTRYGTNSQGVFTNQTDGEYVSYLDFVALVEALEKAQETIAFQQGEIKALLSSLESRTVTVKLPQAVSAGGQGYQEQVERILTAAGIKVEAE
ncbi:TPA: hypothetical protein ACTLRO_000092 [Klebsiella pneumoniae]|uniref:hypothetical protein n=1 Tax=Enterobacteriaceae TaxID=543 RepID=UPI00036CE3BD|nr:MULTISPECIES: hypothetical protein [Enterobacteriaceae]EFB9826066.1 hypothetical protein [Escherichia coli]EFJ2099076.1 hypothetical protein [Escherichia coli]EFK0779521.1 hypothetical protein [Escherichia coli]EFK5469092.1 hypothetical protein [Escherichia coli]EFK5511174.1 hypothetical protein [Escherichia coli]